MIKEIKIEHLKPGMHVVSTGLEWDEKPNLYAQEGPIESEGQLAAIKQKGFTSAFVDTDKGRDSRDRPKLSLNQAVSSNLEEEKQRIASSITIEEEKIESKASCSVSLNEELAIAEKVFSESVDFARDFTRDVRLGKAVNYKASEPLAEGIIDSVMRNPNALLNMKQLKSFDEYTFTHSINVAVLAAIFGRHLGFSRSKLKLLGQSAIFHDLGKAQIPDAILNKPGKLTDEEFKIMQSHPYKGYHLLKDIPDIDRQVLLGVMDHHEKYNGQGYPRKLGGKKLSVFGRLLAVVDVYDALTSRRVYKPGIQPNQALQIMFGMRENDFYPFFVERFIKCLGIYPVGSLVRLSSGEIGVVTEGMENNPLLPTVRVFMDPNMNRKKPRTVKLIRYKDKVVSGSSLIKETLDAAALNIDVSEYMPRPEGSV